MQNTLVHVYLHHTYYSPTSHAMLTIMESCLVLLETLFFGIMRGIKAGRPKLMSVHSHIIIIISITTAAYILPKRIFLL